ncbi:hypothetical protein Ciccas_011143 [Cichlidogyrus casuarinus]|uniref:Uncharacterized protein n=1 Tax=Cichlidogyrus casuarinus TaxID=1844966 RepID=A0ABD2PS53_9PLAT
MVSDLDPSLLVKGELERFTSRLEELEKRFDPDKLTQEIHLLKLEQSSDEFQKLLEKKLKVFEVLSALVEKVECAAVNPAELSIHIEMLRKDLQNALSYRRTYDPSVETTELDAIRKDLQATDEIKKLQVDLLALRENALKIQVQYDQSAKDINTKLMKDTEKAEIYRYFYEHMRKHISSHHDDMEVVEKWLKINKKNIKDSKDKVSALATGGENDVFSDLNKKQTKIQANLASVQAQQQAIDMDKMEKDLNKLINNQLPSGGNFNLDRRVSDYANNLIRQANDRKKMLALDVTNQTFESLQIYEDMNGVLESARKQLAELEKLENISESDQIKKLIKEIEEKKNQIDVSGREENIKKMKEQLDKMNFDSLNGRLEDFLSAIDLAEEKEALVSANCESNTHASMFTI